MKRYLIWVAAVYVLLLLLPLPLLGKANTDKEPLKTTKTTISTTDVTQPTGTQSTTMPTTSQNQTANDGVFRILNKDTGAVSEVPDKEFVIGTVAVEMYPTYHAEALKAQAVACYTYYSVQRNKQRAAPDEALKGADLSISSAGLPLFYTTDQLKARWGDNYTTNYKKISDAVEAVFGKRITYNGELIQAVYHAISAGTTDSAAVVWGNEIAYLQPVASPGDNLSPAYESNVSLTPDQFSQKLKAAIQGLQLSGQPDTWLGNDLQTAASGTVTKLSIGGTALTGQQIRDALGLRSACFTVRFKDGLFSFNVLGYGHNVGMSQYGADVLARQGSTWDEILHFYYTGVTIA